MWFSCIDPLPSCFSEDEATTLPEFSLPSCCLRDHGRFLLILSLSRFARSALWMNSRVPVIECAPCEVKRLFSRRRTSSELKAIFRLQGKECSAAPKRVLPRTTRCKSLLLLRCPTFSCPHSTIRERFSYHRNDLFPCRG